MQIRLLKSRIDEIAENNCGDSDGAWWIQDTIENSLDILIDEINDKLVEKDQIVLVPEEKYLKCICQFEPKMEQGKYGYREILVNTSYCEEHADENPDLYDRCGNRKPCPECAMDHEE